MNTNQQTSLDAVNRNQKWITLDSLTGRPKAQVPRSIDADHLQTARTNPRENPDGKTTEAVAVD